MITTNQIKKEIFTLIRKGVYEPAVSDVVNVDVLKKRLFTKHDYDLSDEEFIRIGDELADAGEFYWNDHGKLALSAAGLVFLERSG